jgi:hypothetical protein
MAVLQGTRPYLVYLGAVFPSEGSPGKSTLPTNSYTLANWLELVYESVVANSEIGEVRLIGHCHPETGLTMVSIGQAIQVVNFTGASATNDNTDPGIANGAVVFDGVVAKINFSYQGDREAFQIVAYNSADFLFRRIALHGQVRRSYNQETYYIANGVVYGAFSLNYNPVTGSVGGGSSSGSSGSGDVVLIDTPLIFNPDGEPNATTQTYFLQSGTNNNISPIFEVPFRNQIGSSGASLQAAYWTLSDAIQYLLNLYPTTPFIDPASYGDAALNIFTVNGNPIVSNVNCEGKSLGMALADLLTPYNYGYWIEPGISPGAATGIPQHRIHFF